MSARRRKSKPSQHKSTAVLERDVPQESRAGRVPQIKAGGTNFQPLNDKVIQSMYQHMGPQQNTDTLYAPGAPIRPIPGLLPPGGPRVFEYQAGANIAQLPRATEQYSFTDLRALASMYDGIQMCQQVWFDYVSRLELVIEPREELIDEDMDISVFQDDILKYIEFFSEPDKELNFHEWLCKAVHEQLEIDALAIFPRKDRIGRLYSLDIIDGAGIKPLIDDRGRRPQLPYPAYEQYWHGLPAAFLTADDLIYVKETQRTDSVYGRSRVERIILRVNQALRKETKDLARFTDGNVPAGVIEVAMDVQWSQEEIEAYEQQFNNMMAGNDEMRARIKVMPRGFIYKPTDDPDIHIDLDQFILTHTAACHGLTLDELAMTSTSNRSVGQSQENVVYRRAMGPLMGRYAKLLTHILRKFFKEKRFVAKLRGYEEKEDFNTMAGAYATLTTAGIQSPTQAARAMHLPVWQDVEVPPFILPKGGQPLLIEDLANPKLRQAQLDAQMAGLELAKTNPGGKPQDTTNNEEEGDEEENDTQQKTVSPGTGSTKESKAPNAHARANTPTQVPYPASRQAGGMDTVDADETGPHRRDVDGADAQGRNTTSADYGIWRKGSCTCSACQVNDGVVRKAGDAFPSGAYNVGGHSGCDCRIEPYQATQREEESPAVQRLMAEVAAILKRLDAAQPKPVPVQHTGIMVAFMLDPVTAEFLAVPDGEPAGDMHITLCFLGDKSEYGDDFSALTRAVSDFAADASPLTGNVSGLARFAPSESSEGKVPVVALVNVKGIQQMREALVKHLETYGYHAASDFEYIPHVTLTYLDPGAEMPVQDVPQLPLALGAISLCIGDDRTHFQLGSIPPPSALASERAMRDEYRKWRDKAIEDIKRGIAFRGFTTTLIPEHIHTRITTELAECETADDVRALFKRTKEWQLEEASLS